MRILVLSQYWHPDNGVPQRRWAWMSELLKNGGHEVYVVTPSSQGQVIVRGETLRQRMAARGRTRESEAATLGVFGEQVFHSRFVESGHSLVSKITSHAVATAGMAGLMLRRRKELDGLNFDVVIGTVPALPVSELTKFAGWMLGIPYVIELRDAWPELLRDSVNWNESLGEQSLRQKLLIRGPLQILVRMTEYFLDRAISGADGIITTSVSLEKWLRSNHRDSATLQYLPMCTIRNVFPAESMRHELPTPAVRPESRELNVLYAGTIGRAQRLENAIQAAKIAETKGYRVNLRLIGEGAGLPEVARLIEELDATVELLPRVHSSELESHYDWAHTALVELTDWEPFKRTVPSKLYELISIGVHISAVVFGEAAAIVEQLGAGTVVEPENPEALADMWIGLIREPSALRIDPACRQWVTAQREDASRILLSFLAEVTSTKMGRQSRRSHRA